jgi:hypothetical protein
MKLPQLIAARSVGIEKKSNARRPDRRDGISMAIFVLFAVYFFLSIIAARRARIDEESSSRRPVIREINSNQRCLILVWRSAW